MSTAQVGFALPVSVGLRPPEGPRSLQVTFDIIAGEVSVVNVDLKSAGLTCIQTIQIDNSANPLPVTIKVGMTGQLITAQANSVSIRAIFIPMSTLYIECDYAGTAVVVCRLLNVPLNPDTYSAQPPILTVTGTVSVIPPATQAVTQFGAWTVAATQSGVWAVAQSGAWSVAQSGVWSVAATQSGAWSVAQSGAWSVAQSGAWTVSVNGAASSALNITGSTTIKTGAGRLWAVNVISAVATVTFADNGVSLLVISAAGSYTFPGGFPFTTNLTVTAGASVVAVSYS